MHRARSSGPAADRGGRGRRTPCHDGAAPNRASQVTRDAVEARPRPFPARGRALAEVLEVAARRRAALALVLRAGGARPVRRVGRRGHLHEADLADLHPRVQRDRQARHVGQLERDVPVETCIDEAGRAVDQQTQSTQRRVVRRDERAPCEVHAVDGVDLDAADGNRWDRPDLDDRFEDRSIRSERDLVLRPVIDAVRHRRLLGDDRSEAEAADELMDLLGEMLRERRELAATPAFAATHPSPSAPRAMTLVAGPMRGR